MTMLTYAHSRARDRGAESTTRRDIRAAGASTQEAKLGWINWVGQLVFGITLATAALAAIIALDASFYLARFSQ
jgi:hypothetical protein